MFVRAYWSMIEGEVFCTKQFALRACELGDKSLSAEEHVFLSESHVIVNEEGAASLKHGHIDTLSNLKQTLKIAASKFDLDWTPNFSTQGWEKLALSLELRHRITHPKAAAELVVSESELDVHKDAFVWFLEAFNEFQASLLRKCDE
jgi:type I restriction-modification system DNA methylase subunit